MIKQKSVAVKTLKLKLNQKPSLVVQQKNQVAQKIKQKNLHQKNVLREMHVAQRQVKKLLIVIRKNKDAVRQTQKHLDKIYLILQKLEWFTVRVFLLNVTKYNEFLSSSIKKWHKNSPQKDL